jgi:3-oxoacyl-[acyl-carrier-protein] synthase II
VAAEGSGALVLETLEHALDRGAPIYAELRGVGKSNDAYHYAAPDPDGRGAVLAMRAALNDAGVEAESVDHVNMHATSTPMGDTIESNAMKTVFGDHAPTISLSATKSMTGHLLGAAGAVEAIAAVLAIKHGLVPPTINTRKDSLDEGCDLDYTLGEANERPIRVALNNAFGFGGHNTTIAFSAFEE